MGLNISAITNLQPTTGEDLDRWYVWNGHFPGRSDPWPDGYYTGETEHAFCAGSYSGYNRWREHLRQFALRGSAGPIAEGHPFWELVWFSDCDGAIGTTVAANLSRDFAEHEEEAIAFAAGLDGYPGEGDRFLALYRDFRKAFEIAARGGVVVFH